MLQKFPFVFKAHHLLSAAPCNMNATWKARESAMTADASWAQKATRPKARTTSPRAGTSSSCRSWSSPLCFISARARISYSVIFPVSVPSSEAEEDSHDDHDWSEIAKAKCLAAISATNAKARGALGGESILP